MKTAGVKTVDRNRILKNNEFMSFQAEFTKAKASQSIGELIPWFGLDDVASRLTRPEDFQRVRVCS